MAAFVLSLLFFLCTITSVLSQTSQRSAPFDMVSVGDPVLNDLRYLSLQTGIPFLSFTPPLAPGEIRNFLDTIGEIELTPSAEEAYRRLQRRLNPQANISFTSGIFTTSLNINSTLEGRFRFNQDVAEFPENPNINPLLAFPVRFYLNDIFQLYVEPSITMRPNRYRLETFDLNVPTDYYVYDETMPLKFFAAAGGSWWNFQIGRDRLFWGTGHTGSLTFSDNSQYFDFARLSVFSPMFKYSMIVSQLPLRLTRNLFHPDNEIIDSWWDDQTNRTHLIHRYFYLQRLDFTFFNRVSIGIMEGLMVGNSSLELRYLNPLRVFHSLFAWEDYDKWLPPQTHEDWRPGDMIGSFFSVEINWNIMKNLSFYGQFFMDQFARRSELRRNPNPPPNGLGYLAGLQFSRSFNAWASIFFLEFIYTDPFAYILSSPFGSHIQQNRYGQYYYIGFPRDTIALTLGANFFNNDFLFLSGNISWISSGENNKHGLIWNWEESSNAFNQTTPSGTSENKIILSLGAGWQPQSWLIFNTDITGIVSLNNNHISGANAIGGQLSFSVGFRY